ncbi:GNAT family N-acetyltransferase [Plantibacter cousiniae (nom. nud.)]|uniref:Acetyltransferase (GNAT) family protein n=1 Tax=Plantibacter cousiniae (nom. nud.) TaxID=199709 RepID=A0ABY1LP27_9MICO|nr:GNAT family N-acetyltransferase [Plantibacter cousiniae]SKC69228.1 Acetyltransferase (GNAT) family protein [Plantibacter cousiniae]
MTIRISRVAWDDEAGTALRAAQRRELDARYGSDDHEPGTPPTAADITRFLLASDVDDTPLGCGGLRMLGADRAEIKRMFVVQQARGTGVATALLRALEDEARSLGLAELLLETGTEQPDAMRFYEREGYHPIDAFGPYVDEPQSRCYARSLT